MKRAQASDRKVIAFHTRRGIMGFRGEGLARGRPRGAVFEEGERPFSAGAPAVEVAWTGRLVEFLDRFQRWRCS